MWILSRMPSSPFRKMQLFILNPGENSHRGCAHEQFVISTEDKDESIKNGQIIRLRGMATRCPATCRLEGTCSAESQRKQDGICPGELFFRIYNALNMGPIFSLDTVYLEFVKKGWLSCTSTSCKTSSCPSSETKRRETGERETGEDKGCEHERFVIHSAEK
jgi:hypothetical protein